MCIRDRYDNIPLVSYMLLVGKCRECKTHISFQYPLVELLNGIVLLSLFIYYGPTIKFLLLSAFGSCMIVSSFIFLRKSPNVAGSP